MLSNGFGSRARPPRLKAFAVRHSRKRMERIPSGSPVWTPAAKRFRCPARCNILKPTKEIDLWSQLNTNQKEIITNSKIASFILKKNQFYKKYQQYYAVLSGGYIYFYYDDNINDEYIAYFHLKNCIFQELDELSFKLSSNYGSIELKVSDKKIYDSWKNNIINRITEMKISYKFQEDEQLNQKNLELMKENPKQIYFGAETNLKQVIIRLHNDETNNNDKSNIFVVINLSNLKALLIFEII